MSGKALGWAALVFLRSPDYNEYKAVVCQAGTGMDPLSLWHDCPCLHITFDPQDGILWKAQSWSLLINTDFLLAEKRDGVISFCLQLICSSSSLVLLLNFGVVNMERLYPFFNLHFLFSQHNTGSVCIALPECWVEQEIGETRRHGWGEEALCLPSSVSGAPFGPLWLYFQAALSFLACSPGSTYFIPSWTCLSRESSSPSSQWICLSKADSLDPELIIHILPLRNHHQNSNLTFRFEGLSRKIFFPHLSGKWNYLI